jgi:hypothetical protein
MRRHIGIKTLGDLASEMRLVLGGRASQAQLFQDLDRFANQYGLQLEEARRAVMVLHGIPPGLTGPTERRYTWQQEIDAFDAT